MKALLFYFLIFLAGCASKPHPVVHVIHREIPAANLSERDARSVRLGETIKAYPMGRYVDPHNRRIMHEGHTIYRVETTPRWNLYATPPPHPRQGPSIQAPRAGKDSQALNDELLMELNRQKRVTQTVIESGKTLSGKLRELTAKLEQMTDAVKNNAALQKEVDAIKAQITALEGTLPPQQPQPETTW